jgi:hypothetical protein
MSQSQISAAVEVLERAGVELNQFKTASEIVFAARLIAAAQRPAD